MIEAALWVAAALFLGFVGLTGLAVLCAIVDWLNKATMPRQRHRRIIVRP